jgi:23S rRNA (cytidine2498-2'-O)-methyltransferase
MGNFYRRTGFIVEIFPSVSTKARPFPWQVPAQAMGGFLLLDEHSLLYSAETGSPFPGGCITFEEDREGPPSRAYLKLREALLRLCTDGNFPGPASRCLDLGASPGGWTWVLAGLGARVDAVDRAPLDPRIAAMPGVSWQKHDAFTRPLEDLAAYDWICCDAACYPKRLYEWLQKVIALYGGRHHLVCTIKLQHEEDWPLIHRFAAIEGARVFHLYNNKHELTFLRPALA